MLSVGSMVIVTRLGDEYIGTVEELCDSTITLIAVNVTYEGEEGIYIPHWDDLVSVKRDEFTRIECV